MGRAAVVMGLVILLAGGPAPAAQQGIGHKAAESMSHPGAAGVVPAAVANEVGVFFVNIQPANPWELQPFKIPVEFENHGPKERTVQFTTECVSTPPGVDCPIVEETRTTYLPVPNLEGTNLFELLNTRPSPAGTYRFRVSVPGSTWNPSFEHDLVIVGSASTTPTPTPTIPPDKNQVGIWFNGTDPEKPRAGQPFQVVARLINNAMAEAPGTIRYAAECLAVPKGAECPVEKGSKALGSPVGQGATTARRIDCKASPAGIYRIRVSVIDSVWNASFTQDVTVAGQAGPGPIHAVSPLPVPAPVPALTPASDNRIRLKR